MSSQGSDLHSISHLQSTSHHFILVQTLVPWGCPDAATNAQLSSWKGSRGQGTLLTISPPFLLLWTTWEELGKVPHKYKGREDLIFILCLVAQRSYKNVLEIKVYYIPSISSRLPVPTSGLGSVTELCTQACMWSHGQRDSPWVALHAFQLPVAQQDQSGNTKEEHHLSAHRTC